MLAVGGLDLAATSILIADSNKGLFFIARPGAALEGHLIQELRKLAGGRLQSYILGSDSPRDLFVNNNIEELILSTKLAVDYEVALLLTAHTTYAFFGLKNLAGAYQGFHTSDWTIVSSMAGMLRRSYQVYTGTS